MKIQERPRETLHMEEFCSRVPRQVIWKRRPKNDENRRTWTREVATMRHGHLWCALGMATNCHVPWVVGHL